MSIAKPNNTLAPEPPRIKLTAQVSLEAYDALVQIQHHHRTKTGRVLPLWRVLDAALITYAQTQNYTTNK